MAPESSIVTVKYKDSGLPVSSLLVQVYVVPPSKNPYPLEPLVTDTNGSITVHRIDIVNAINDAQRHYPMDYNGSLDDCEYVKFIVANRDTLEKQAIGIREWDDSRGRIFIKMMRSSVNDLVYPCEVTFPLKTLNGRYFDIVRVPAG